MATPMTAAPDTIAEVFKEKYRTVSIVKVNNDGSMHSNSWIVPKEDAALVAESLGEANIEAILPTEVAIKVNELIVPYMLVLHGKALPDDLTGADS